MSRQFVAPDTAGQTSELGPARSHSERLWPYALVGLYLGFVFTRAEVVSWFRIQEMFRFQAFHMYGIIMTAVVVGAISASVLRRLGARASGEPVEISRKELNHGTWIGGTLFGIGWAFTGSCPGPLYAHVGAGSGGGVMIVALLGAIAGTWVYGALRPRLPH